MSHDLRVETSSGPLRTTRGEPLLGSEQVYALQIPRFDYLELRVRALSLCAIEQERWVTRTEVHVSRASHSRFIGAAAAVVGGTTLLSGPGSDGLGVALLGGAGLVVALPMLAAEAREKRLPPEKVVDAGGSTERCRDRPVSGARVAVRLGTETLEGRSDAAGRVHFRDYRGRPDMLVFVDDRAVPWSVGSPVTGTVPASEARARPGGPGSH
jgi:hypothetical protein